MCIFCILQFGARPLKVALAIVNGLSLENCPPLTWTQSFSYEASGDSAMCPLCTRPFRKDKFATHMRTHQTGRYKPHRCPLCEYSTDRKDILTKHLQTHNNDRTTQEFRCSECRYVTHVESHLKQHMRRTHDESRTPVHMCGSCDYSTDYATHFRTHMLIHRMPPKEHVCSLCDFETHRPRAMEAHVQKYHLSGQRTQWMTSC